MIKCGELDLVDDSICLSQIYLILVYLKEYSICSLNFLIEFVLPDFESFDFIRFAVSLNMSFFCY